MAQTQISLDWRSPRGGLRKLPSAFSARHFTGDGANVRAEGCWRRDHRCEFRSTFANGCSSRLLSRPVLLPSDHENAAPWLSFPPSSRRNCQTSLSPPSASPWTCRHQRLLRQLRPWKPPPGPPCVTAVLHHCRVRMSAIPSSFHSPFSSAKTSAVAATRFITGSTLKSGPQWKPSQTPVGTTSTVTDSFTANGPSLALYLAESLRLADASFCIAGGGAFGLALPFLRYSIFFQYSC